MTKNLKFSHKILLAAALVVAVAFTCFILFNDYRQRQSLRANTEASMQELGSLTTGNIQTWLESRIQLLQSLAQQVAVDGAGKPSLDRSLALPEFLAAWPSRAVFVVIGSDFDRNTALLQPSERPSARALYARQGPITDAELVDFGFSHADLF